MPDGLFDGHFLILGNLLCSLIHRIGYDHSLSHNQAIHAKCLKRYLIVTTMGVGYNYLSAMQDLTPHATLESDYAIELADSMNQDMDSDDRVFVYVVHEDVYLCTWADEDEDSDGNWRFEGTFKEAGRDAFGETDQLAKDLDDKYAIIDVPGTDLDRAVYVREE